MTDSIEHLLAPRYKVIADYPNSPYYVGQVLSGDSYKTNEPYGGRYPKIFVKLEWWEERQESEMPRFVKVNNPNLKCHGDVKQVTTYCFDTLDDRAYFIQGWLELEHLLPATEQDYLTYTSQIK